MRFITIPKVITAMAQHLDRVANLRINNVGQYIFLLSYSSFLFLTLSLYSHSIAIHYMYNYNYFFILPTIFMSLSHDTVRRQNELICLIKVIVPTHM